MVSLHDTATIQWLKANLEAGEADLRNSRWLAHYNRVSETLPDEWRVGTFYFEVAPETAHGIQWTINSYRQHVYSPETALHQVMGNLSQLGWQIERQSQFCTLTIGAGHVTMYLRYPAQMAPVAAVRSLLDQFTGNMPDLILFTLFIALHPGHQRACAQTYEGIRQMTLGLMLLDSRYHHAVAPITDSQIRRAAQAGIAQLTTAAEAVPPIDPDTTITEIDIAVLQQYNIGHTVDIARYLVARGAHLWDQEAQQAGRDRWLTCPSNDLLPLIANAYARYIPPDIIRGKNNMISWTERVEVCNLPESTRQFLTGRNFPEWFVPGERLRQWNARYMDKEQVLAGLSSALLRAALPPHYTPAGRFYLLLPPEHPLRELDVTQLGIIADSTELWCIPLLADGRRLFACRWQPQAATGRLSPWLRYDSVEWYATIIDATLTALWHDLCVAGETVIVTTHPRAQAPTMDAGPHLTRAERRRQARQLPRRKVIRAAAPATERVIDWERIASTRAAARAHAVCGHPRSLRPDQHASEMALVFAGDYGLIVPDGYTFVRPHVRGASVAEGESPEPVPVKAKALLTLSLLLQKEA